jgi:tetratricopeptide (TPR) repeat protein
MPRPASLLIALLCLSGAARADSPPTFWQRLGKPNVVAEQSLHVEARRALLRRDEGVEDFALFGELRRQDQLMLTMKQLEKLPKRTPLLSFDLGQIYEELGMHRAAIQTLRPLVDLTARAGDAAATDDAAKPAFLEDAWLTLAYAYAKSEDTTRERDAYLEYLKLAKHPRSRNIATLNLAEAEMRLGNLEAAIVGYRDAFTQASMEMFSDETVQLATWGLAVALDRYGDRAAARLEADRAVRLDKGLKLIEHGERVFFVPDYEVHWYSGLGWLASARAEDVSPEERVSALLKATAAWEKYVKSARPDDLWLPQARAHLADAAKKLKAAERAAPAPAPKAGPPMWPWLDEGQPLTTPWQTTP